MDRVAHNQQLIYQSIVYICGFLLFWEWLRPLETISDTGSLSIFVIYAAFCFLISMLKVKWWVSMVLKLIGIVFIVDGLFISETIFSGSWFYLLSMHLEFNVEMISNQQWSQMTPLFRSLLFLILLWLMSYLLYYWFVIAKRVFLFILLTFIYLAVLDTFTTYNAEVAIVRTFIISLVAMGISSIMKELNIESIKQLNFKNLTTWFIPIIIVIFFSTFVGFLLPKLDPQWPDPVPFITSTAGHVGFGEGQSPIQKVGYGEDDSQLGGSFIQDETPVFKATVEKSHYWRIESKDMYTGLGWERSSKLVYQEQNDGQIGLDMFDDTLETEDYTAIISFESGSELSKVVYPYGIKEIKGNDQVQYLLDDQTGTIEAEGPEQRGILDNYEIDYSYPSFSVDRLSESSGADPDDIQDLYLQLPNSLPERVRDLAQEIVAEDETRYEKVTSVERYFSRNGYSYSTQDVAIPDQGQDYVDQFLFETKVGYCDNFSTSMVVLLRSLDIPARWVKGFTAGQQIDSDLPLPELSVYQVRNSNAHSWVEVYFPDVGWVPFEPTKGFSSPVDFYEETSSNLEDLENETEQNTEEEPEEETEDQPAPGVEDFETDTAASSGDSDGVMWNWILSAAIFVVLIVLLYSTRYRWMTAFLLQRYKKRHDAKVYQDAYHFLLKVLDHKGFKREQGQTLRDYANYIDKRFESNEMSRFTHHYERFLYRNEIDSDKWGEMTELWESLIKRSLS
ncbi:DUF4129 domain-containing transglutaminase family protein [Aquibacillus rhizosphaerae]|uniref:Transglutaminase domain-containing protein n=1 Tax=Aquibacillus rhizosphaerae TaxID=3051431 RepID=A0ABT7LBR0_9BACI|nr:transglutaminase domain-containing protein [Aquibacillus sp. LR5S19]MDL4842001.1 transglutaminase domain-containing protein [Aquibacillus sp. LR5S19]